MDVIGTIMCWLTGVLLALPIAAFIIVKPRRRRRHLTLTVDIRPTPQRPKQLPWPSVPLDTRVERYRAGAAR